MTEHEWLASDDPQAMLRLKRTNCCDRLWVDNGDGTMSPCAGFKPCWQCDNWSTALCTPFNDHKLRLWVFACREAEEKVSRLPIRWFDKNLENMGELHGCVKTWATGLGSREVAMSFRADLLREIMGNPWRPVAVNTSWLTWNDSAIPRLAQDIYDEQRFEDIPILADALEESGCNDADILMHLRGYELCPECLGTGMINFGLADGQCSQCLFASTRIDSFGDRYMPGCGFIRSRCSHVRGCWAIELLAGRN